MVALSSFIHSFIWYNNTAGLVITVGRVEGEMSKCDVATFVHFDISGVFFFILLAIIIKN